MVVGKSGGNGQRCGARATLLPPTMNALALSAQVNTPQDSRESHEDSGVGRIRGGTQDAAGSRVVPRAREFRHARASTGYDLLSRGRQSFVIGRWSAERLAASGTPGHTKHAAPGPRSAPSLASDCDASKVGFLPDD